MMIDFKFGPIEYQPKNLCNAWVATAIVGSAVIGAVSQGYGASKAADAQQASATAANAGIQNRYDETNKNLQPFRQIGDTASTELTNRLGELTAPINMTQAQLEQTPGYQFTLAQGLKATQNSAAARGLGVSGAALKGAATFATGLADKTYLDQFGVANTNQTNAYNRLKGLVDTGENAAAQTGVIGTTAANQVAGNTVGAGNAAAAADNRIGSSIAGGANNIGGYLAYENGGIYGNNGRASGPDYQAPLPAGGGEGGGYAV